MKKKRSQERVSILMRRAKPNGMTRDQRAEKLAKKFKFAKLKNKFYRRKRPLHFGAFRKIWKKVKRDIEPFQKHLNFNSIYRTYYGK